MIGSPDGPQAALTRTGGGGQGTALAFLMNTPDTGITPMLMSQVVNGGTGGQYLQTLMQGPGNTMGDGNQFNLVLNSGSDDGTTPAVLVVADGTQVPFLSMMNTGTPAMFIGSVPGGPQAFVPVTVNGGFLMYGTAAGGKVIRTFTGAGAKTFTPPEGVTVLDRVEHIGAGAGGQCASGPGGGSGEYAAATNVTVTPLHTYTFTNGTGGTRGVLSSRNGGAGTSTTSTWDAITITAHGAPANNGTFSSNGGAGSTAPIHRNGSGGTGYKGATNGGGGGAGAPNRYGPGAVGAVNYHINPGAGGKPAAGGLAGWGAWGGWGSPGSGASTTGGFTGASGGGGGGSGGADGYTGGATGGPGGAGITQITYTLPGGTALLASMTSQPVTDTDGNVAPAGFQGQLVAVKPGTSPSVPETWHTMTLLNGWTATSGNVTPKYRLVGSPPSTVEVIGAIHHSGATGATFCQLPAGYRPVSQQQIPCGTAGATTWSNNTPFIQCDSSGNLSGQGEPPSTVDMVFHGFISLDA